MAAMESGSIHLKNNRTILMTKRVFPYSSFINILLLVLLSAVVAPVNAAQPVPFKGHSENQAISAELVDAEHVFVTTIGEGNATHLGNFTFVSPHLSGLLDFSIDGIQIITAANGDELQTILVGNLHPEIDETGHVFLVGSIAGTITGGTGRFSNATGSFTFTLTFDTETAHSFAEIDGTIQYSGK
jgi:hypothetical protein